MGQIIVVASQKGGVGKTTTSINLGASLAIFGKRVLIIDLDAQGSIAASFGIDEFAIKYGTYDLIVKKIPLAMAITDIGLENMEIVPANVENEEEELEIFTHGLQNELIKSILKPVKDEYDFIILDCPPSLGAMTINGVVAADQILIPIQSEYYALKSLGKFLNSIKNIGNKYNKNLKFSGILVTMFDQRIRKNREILEELKHSFKDILFETIIPRNSRIAEAPSIGKPVALFDLSSKGAIAYFQLAEEVLSKNSRN
jgi:chromosome partitioning protein